MQGVDYSTLLVGRVGNACEASRAWSGIIGREAIPTIVSLDPSHGGVQEAIKSDNVTLDDGRGNSCAKDLDDNVTEIAPCGA